MNESGFARFGVLAALLAALLLGGCRADPGPPPLDGATMGGPFTLTSHDGRRVSESDFAGRYRLVYFGFTFCPDVCPTDLQVLAAGLRRFEASDAERAARVQPLFVTVDPARDTPEALRAYVANFHPRLVGLTGSEEEIARVARAYGAFEREGHLHLVREFLEGVTAGDDWNRLHETALVGAGIGVTPIMSMAATL